MDMQVDKRRDIRCNHCTCHLGCCSGHGSLEGSWSKSTWWWWWWLSDKMARSVLSESFEIKMKINLQREK